MAYIDPKYLDCVIYLYPSRRAADAGERVGGSGFLLAYPSGVEDYHYYGVTNEHVITRAKSPVIRLNTKDGRRDVLEFSEDDWIPHPDGDDVAVCPIALPLDAYANTALDWDSVTTDNGFLLASEVDVGADVFTVGRFINHEGKQRNTPAVRFGNIAMMPHEPIERPGETPQQSFLVEMRSQGGYSGSPVFLALPEHQYEPYNMNPYPAPVPFRHIRLLGLIWAHIPDNLSVMIPNESEDEEDREHPDDWYVKANTNMAAVVPSWRLRSLLESEDLRKQRKSEDERRLERKQRRERRPTFQRDALPPEEMAPLTREDFEKALRRASRKISSQSESESDGT